jgi:hypothetical protein
VLGPKFDEYGIMVDQVKKNLQRVATMVHQAYPLDLQLQHSYAYSKWD